MLIDRRALLVATLWLVAGGDPGHAQTTGWPVHRDERAGFELRHPPAFVASAYRNTLPPDLLRKLREAGGRVPFEHALALVEPARLGAHDRAALPVGEVTTITIEAHAAAEAAARLRLGRQIYGAGIAEITIGAHRVQRFPGFPGPYGTAAFYYLVPLQNGAGLELTAHRKFLEPPPGDTRYDRVIEQIIATLTIFAPRP